MNPSLVEITNFLYIDPNTGGLLFQLLAVLFAMFSGMMLFFSRQIKTFFSNMKRKLRRKNEVDGKKL
jgi:hypothetical protein